MIFREGGLNLIWGQRNIGKTSLILRGIAAGSWTSGLIICDSGYNEFAYYRYSRANIFPVSEELDDLKTADISDGGIIILHNCIYDPKQWILLIPRLIEYRRRRITVVIAFVCMFYKLPRAIVEDLFDRVFLFRNGLSLHRRQMFKMFGYIQFPTRADFEKYMNENGEGPFWYGAFDLRDDAIKVTYILDKSPGA